MGYYVDHTKTQGQTRRSRLIVDRDMREIHFQSWISVLEMLGDMIGFGTAKLSICKNYSDLSCS